MIQSLLEKNMLPDFLIRSGIRSLNKQRLKEEIPEDIEKAKAKVIDFVSRSKNYPIAIATQEANDQHYELPPGFFELVLGKHLKYSSCNWDATTKNLDEAETLALNMVAERADIVDGMEILEIGCGWGSLTLFLGAKFPKSQITAVSNSAPQRKFIMGQAKERGLDNVNVITKDINDLALEGQFDRICSIEMFEHARNYDKLFSKMEGYLKPGGKMFLHVFTHRDMPYFFELDGKPGSVSDFMARYFFTGGTMPSNDLFLYYAAPLTLQNQWVVNGQNYAKTSRAWLENMDTQRKPIMEIFRNTYGEADAVKWFSYWRVFFMAVEELFAYKKGTEWMVCHYLFEKPASE